MVIGSLNGIGKEEDKMAFRRRFRGRRGRGRRRGRGGRRGRRIRIGYRM